MPIFSVYTGVRQENRFKVLCWKLDLLMILPEYNHVTAVFMVVIRPLAGYQ